MYVAGKRGLPRKFARFVLFRPIKKRSFNLLRVWHLFFSERWQSTLFRIFFFFFSTFCYFVTKNHKPGSSKFLSNRTRSQRININEFINRLRQDNVNEMSKIVVHMVKQSTTNARPCGRTKAVSAMASGELATATCALVQPSARSRQACDKEQKKARHSSVSSCPWTNLQFTARGLSGIRVKVRCLQTTQLTVLCLGSIRSRPCKGRSLVHRRGRISRKWQSLSVFCVMTRVS